MGAAIDHAAEAEAYFISSLILSVCVGAAAIKFCVPPESPPPSNP